MSGGSLDYAFQRVEEVASNISSRATKPLHRAFSAHLLLVAEALHDLEWVWSSDMSNGDEDESIRRVVDRVAEIKAATDSLKIAIVDAEECIKACEDIL